MQELGLHPSRVPNHLSIIGCSCYNIWDSQNVYAWMLAHLDARCGPRSRPAAYYGRHIRYNPWQSQYTSLQCVISENIRPMFNVWYKISYDPLCNSCGNDRYVSHQNISYLTFSILKSFSITLVCEIFIVEQITCVSFFHLSYITINAAPSRF